MVFKVGKCEFSKTLFLVSQGFSVAWKSKMTVIIVSGHYNRKWHKNGRFCSRQFSGCLWPEITKSAVKVTTAGDHDRKWHKNGRFFFHQFSRFLESESSKSVIIVTSGDPDRKWHKKWSIFCFTSFQGLLSQRFRNRQ